MTEDRSPWARPEAGQTVDAGWTVPPPAPHPARTSPDDATSSLPAHLAGGELVAAGYRSGTVTAPGTPLPGGLDRLDDAPPDLSDLARRNRLMLRWFGAGAAAIVVSGLVVLLVVALTASGSGFSRPAAQARDTRPQLAKLCPPPSTDPGRPDEAPAAPPGPRTSDDKAGISYQAYGEPWQPWVDHWSKGTLQVTYRTGQYFVTENYINQYGDRSSYLASILSGSVPVSTNDALTVDLVCTGGQVVADVRASYYPQPNTVEKIRDEQTVLGGRRAWVSVFRMHFTEKGLIATDELVAVALIDVGRPEAAVLYVSIPGTHHQWDHVVDEVLNSVRPI